MQLGLSRSPLAVAHLRFVCGLFVPGFSRNPWLEVELDMQASLQSSALSLLPSPSRHENGCSWPCALAVLMCAQHLLSHLASLSNAEGDEPEKEADFCDSPTRGFFSP